MDGKGSLYDWGLDEWDSDSKRALMDNENVRVRVPPPRKIAKELYWSKIMNLIYEAGNVTVYIDELYAIVDPGSKPTPEFNALYTRGREFGIGVWASTQRPVFVPLVAISESEVFFMFRLTLDEDRKRMAAFMTPRVVATIKDLHGFHYMRADWESPEYTSGLVLKPKKELSQ